MTQVEEPRNHAAAQKGSQYLTFRLEKEEYAIDILGVQEIKGFSTITPIPNTPPFIKGVTNLRGTVVPIVGLRESFGMPAIAYDRFTVIVIVNVAGKSVGVVVDAVTDVLSLDQAEIGPPPDLGASVDTSFITGVAKTAERLVIVLDVEKALGEVLRSSSIGASPPPTAP